MATSTAGGQPLTRGSPWAKIVALMGVAATVIGLGIWLALDRHRSDTPSNFGQAPTFELIDAEGAPFSSEALRGKVWLVSFFFTSCESVCPMVIGKMARLFEHAPQEMRFVSITIDPTRDTPPELKRYAERFDADPQRWHFLTGTPDSVRAVVADGFKVTMPTGAGDLDRHSVRLVLVDQEGHIRGYFSSTDPDEMARLKGILDVYRGTL